MLAERLDELTTVLASVKAPVLAHLEPPADLTRIQAVLAEAGAAPHPDLVTWWSWHDGTNTPAAVEPPGGALPSPDNRLIADLHLITLDQALVAHRGAQAVEAGDPLDPPAYWPGCFPMLRFVDGWLVMLDTRGVARERWGVDGEVFVWDPHAYDFDGPRPWFRDLEGLIGAVVAAYQSGQVSPAALVVDWDALGNPARRLRY